MFTAYDEGVSLVCKPDTRSQGALLKNLDTLQIPDRLFNILYGLLLGYETRDIRAWHISNWFTEDLHRDFFKNRKKIIGLPGTAAQLRQYNTRFDALLHAAHNLLEVLRR